MTSHEAHLFPNTRFQAPLESSLCLAGAANFRGDLELDVMEKLGLGMRPTPIIHPIRINLVAPFADKDAVKALGARWDAANKNWYIVDVEDITPFLRWIPNSGTDTENMAGVATPQAMKSKKAPVQQSKGTVILKLDDEVPHCGCNVQPWEDCPHTEIR